ncbi:hypothetical protein F5Y15DRAFT_32029 [Xylariaceae sp. FL0016]|nr:hypothetical protein F5Y15DRAFT_32029 [Xylariaceae sp. FL0016]
MTSHNAAGSPHSGLGLTVSTVVFCVRSMAQLVNLRFATIVTNKWMIIRIHSCVSLFACLAVALLAGYLGRHSTVHFTTELPSQLTQHSNCIFKRNISHGAKFPIQAMTKFASLSTITPIIANLYIEFQ